jgi:hypothetical protein
VSNDSQTEWAKAITSLMWLRYNASTKTVLGMAYAHAETMCPDYLQVKAERWERCPLSFYAQLDAENAARFIEMLMRMYSDQAGHRVRAQRRFR